MYRLTDTDAILRLADGALIPADPANRQYRAYLAWTQSGGTPEAAPIQAAPRTATAKQLRYALNATGQRGVWDAALAAASADTRDYWQVEPNPPETSAKLRRLAKAAGVDLAALFDTALEY